MKNLHENPGVEQAMDVLIDGDPQRLGDYWLAGRLGAGGQGVVYEAYAESGQRVAIKVLHGDQAAQLAREAAAAQRVASFCTATVIETQLEGPRPYIVSEYVEGPSLRKAVTGGRRFTGGDLHRLATAVATALTAIHDAGVIHRDMKPDNVLLGPDGPRVIDFGIARTAEMSLTATGLVTGTPTYMAPEVFSGHRAGMPADVFAWGGIMLYAATGEDPFQAESLGGVMHRVLSDNPDLSVLPSSLHPLVAAALAKEPLHRPTARQLLLALVSGDARAETAYLLAQGGKEAAHISVAADDPALGKLAEDAFGLLGAEERELVAEVFLRLVTVDEQGRLSGRRAAVSELVEGRPLPEVSAITRILEVFAYLLGRQGEEIWLLRPALPHAWPRFRRWVDANRDGLAVHKQILSGARRWQQAGRRDGDLLQGDSLENALQWAATARRNITLSPPERDFLAAGAALTRRRARRNRLVALSLTGLLVISLVAGGLAVQQSMLADERADRIAAQRDQAEAARIAALADTLRNTDPPLAMLLSTAAWRLDRTPQTRAALTASLHRRETTMFRDPATAADTVRTLSADGRTLVSVSEDAALVRDVRTGKQTGKIGKLGISGEQMASVAFAPTGRTLIVLTDKRARAWDLRSGKVARTWTFGRPLDLRSGSALASFGATDRLAVVTVRGKDYVWDLATGRRTQVPARAGVMAPTGNSIFVMTEKGRVERWSLPGLTFQRRLRVEGDAGCENCGPPEAVSPDGKWLAQSLEKVLHLTDLANGTVDFIGDRDGAGQQGDWNQGVVTFSGDGRLLASVTDKSVQFWRTADTQLLTTVTVMGNSDSIPSSGFDPDGRTFRYLVEDQVFSVDIADLVTVPHEDVVDVAAFGPDGRLMTVSNSTTGTRLQDWRSGKRLGTITGKRDVTSVSFSTTNGLAAIGHPGKITIMDAGSRAVIGEIVPGEGDLEPVSTVFSPDGTRLAVVLRSPDDGRAVIDHATQLWDWAAGRRLWTATLGEVTDLAFSPDGKTLAVAGGEERLLDAATGKSSGKSFGSSGMDTSGAKVFFTHSGRSVVVLDSRGRMTLWDAVTRRRGPVSHGTPGILPAAAYSPREDLVAVGVTDGRVQLFDPSSGTTLGTLVDTGGGQVPAAAQLQSVAFTPDGSAVVTVALNGAVHQHLIDPERMAKEACTRAGRTLTAQEWNTYLPSVPHFDVCRR
ncbi:protein kinase domain-containing protein [Nonomuraea sp. H19]|uniref:protein kinase domain-containing protein n=1 Tax=Nonomuraea sp. H19 TaxID=3452206 RepID=UPI003F8A5BC9